MAPYYLPADLQRLTLGVSWKTLGQPGGTSPSDPENQAAILDICHTATSLANDELNQDVRSSLVAEEVYGPSPWAGVLQSGVGRLILAFNPVVDVPFAAIAPASTPYPKPWRVLPSGAAWAEKRPTGVYGVSQPSPVSGGLNAVLLAAGILWKGVPHSQQVALCYSHGWPHASLVSPAAAGDAVLQVDEVCGFTGAASTVSDGASTEVVQVVSVTLPGAASWSAGGAYFPGNLVAYNGQTWQATMASGQFAPSGSQVPGSGPYWSSSIYPVGPGTLNLASPLRNPHASIPVLVTSMPHGVCWGMALYAKSLVLQKGMATVAPPSREGKALSTSEAIEEATVAAVAALRPFARVV